jgi:glycosyltransferase involved in cell wall biosynthesis
MNNTPLVSILTALFNHEKYIKEALDSVLKEDYLNKELIIVNDGSTDNSEQIVKEWIKENGHLIHTEYYYRSNKGVCETANELVGKAHGKYLVWLPSDDALFGNSIGKRVSLLEENEKKGKLVLVSDAKVIDSKSFVTKNSSMTEYNNGNKNKYYNDNGILEEVLLNPSVSGPTLMINKSIYKKIGTYPKNLKGEDWFFMQRAASINSILFWDNPVGLYRVHELNTSGEHITLDKKLDIVFYILKTFCINFLWFPTTKSKLLALKQILKYSLSLAKLKLKIFLSRIKN